MSVAKEIRDLMGRCSRLETQVAKLPTRIGNSAGGSGSGSAQTQVWTTASTKAGLDNDSVAETLLGRVTDGGQAGMVCVRNAANDGWVSINFWDT